MASQIETAIQNLQDDMRTIPGMRQAPYVPPDNIQAYPFCTAYPDSFTAKLGQPAQMYTVIYEVVLQLHVTRKDLPRAYEQSIKYPEAVLSKLLANMTLDGVGTVVTEDGPTVNGTWQEVVWSDESTPTIAWEIRFPFKIQAT